MFLIVATAGKKIFFCPVFLVDLLFQSGMPAFKVKKVIGSVPRLRHLKMQCPSFPSVRVRGRDPLLMNVSSGRLFFGLPFYLKEIAAFLVQWGSLFPLNQCPGREL